MTQTTLNKPFTIEDMPGLRLHSGYLELRQHNWLVATIDESAWTGKRRVQHYGYTYGSKVVRKTPWPLWCEKLAVKLQMDGLLPFVADQCSVDECLPGQGIALHADNKSFEAASCIISLQSGVVMDFERKRDKWWYCVYLPVNSALVLEGEARHKWRHGIVARETDVVNSATVRRKRRLSLTFRKVILEG